MPEPPPNHSPVRFGPFEIDLNQREVRRSGIRVKVQNQPFQILEELIRRPGELVDREHLRSVMWSQDTFVDFERGLNAAVNKLRQALGDSAVSPRYIETVAGRGYRFLAAVEPVEVSAPGTHNAYPPRGRGFGRFAVAGAIFGVFLLGMVVGWLSHFHFSHADPGNQRLQFMFLLPKGSSIEPAFSHQEFAIAPDGSRVAFLNKSQLWIHEFSTGQAWLLASDHDVGNFSWSNDARSVYYSVSSSLRRVSLETHESILISELPPGTNWLTLIELKKDLALFTRTGHAFLLSQTGGGLRPFSTDDDAFIWPQILSPNHLLYVSFDPSIQKYKLWFRDLDNPQSKRAILETDSRVQYTAIPGDNKGYLLYVRAGTLVAQPFDAIHQTLAGEPRPIADDIFWFQPTASAAFSVSANGVLTFRRWSSRSQLEWVDRSGHELTTVGKPSLFLTPLRLSPDGARAAAGIYDPHKGGTDIWVYDLDRHLETRLTQTNGHSASPVWAPDGDHVAYLNAMAASPTMYRTSLSARETQRLLPENFNNFQLPTDWSGDGRYLLYQTAGSTQAGVGVNSIDVHRPTTPITILRSSSQETEAVFSPDSHWLAYISSNTGQDEAYIQALSLDPQPNALGKPVRVSSDGAKLIRWRADGKEIFFLDRENWISASNVDVKNGQVRTSVPIKLFRLKDAIKSGSVGTGFDISLDGQKFLIADPVKDDVPSIEVIKNWAVIKQ